MYFLAGSAVTQAVSKEFAAALVTMKAGETTVLQLTLKDGTKACYVLMRCELDSGAWSDSANKTWFESFNDVLREYMLQNMVRDGGYIDRVVVNEAVKEKVDITMVATNNFY